MLEDHQVIHPHRPDGAGANGSTGGGAGGGLVGIGPATVGSAHHHKVVLVVMVLEVQAILLVLHGSGGAVGLHLIILGVRNKFSNKESGGVGVQITNIPTAFGDSGYFGGGGAGGITQGGPGTREAVPGG